MPHCGHTSAWSETIRPHPLHFISAITQLLFQVIPLIIRFFCYFIYSMTKVIKKYILTTKRILKSLSPNIITIHVLQYKQSYATPYHSISTAPISFSIHHYRFSSSLTALSHSSFPLQAIMTRHQKSLRKAPALRRLHVKKAATYSPTLHCSTIGADGLNFSVRNGKRWNPDAITT